MTEQHANMKISCPLCQVKIQLPDRDTLLAMAIDRPVPELKRRGNQSHSSRPVTNKKSFSFRVLFAAILTGLQLLGGLMILLAGILIACYGDSPEMADVKEQFTALFDQEVDTKAQLAAFLTQIGIYLFFLVAALIGICNRGRVLALLTLVVSSILSVGFEQIPVLSVLAIILVLLPGRSKAWAK